MSLLVDIRKNFGTFRLDVSFEAGDETLALLGASGCGKSMTLRCIAGIVTPDAGRIVLDNSVLFDSEKHINLSPQQRRVGLLFQNYALFPTMTVAQNILCGMGHEKSRETRQASLRMALSRFYLEGLEHRFPDQLSGGQQQRAALARILVSQPRLLMLDEPFSALDSHLRWELEQEVLSLTREFCGTTLLVSHNRDEVYRLSHRVAVYNQGRIDVLDEKWELFENPRTYHSALLTGCKNLAPATLREGLLDVPQWGLTLSPPRVTPVNYIGIRAHDLLPALNPGINTFPYEILQRIEDTFSMILMIRPKGGSGAPLRWELSKEQYRCLEQCPFVSVAPEKILMLT